MNKYLIAVACLMAGCAKDDKGGAVDVVSCEGKPFASTWFRINSSGYFIELRFDGAAINATTEVYIVIDKSLCLIDLTVIGNECRGAYQIENSQYVSGGDGMGCGTLNGSGEYKKDSTNLTLAEPGYEADFQ